MYKVIKAIKAYMEEKTLLHHAKYKSGSIPSPHHCLYIAIIYISLTKIDLCLRNLYTMVKSISRIIFWKLAIFLSINSAI